MFQRKTISTIPPHVNSRPSRHYQACQQARTQAHEIPLIATRDRGPIRNVDKTGAVHGCHLAQRIWRYSHSITSVRSYTTSYSLWRSLIVAGQDWLWCNHHWSCGSGRSGTLSFQYNRYSKWAMTVIMKHLRDYEPAHLLGSSGRLVKNNVLVCGAETGSC